jgi:hypothetical protein
VDRGADFVFPENAAASGVIVPNVVFPSVSNAQRKLVHNIAEQFGMTSESFGDEGHRSVWVTLTPQAKVPSRLLSSILTEQQQAVEAKGRKRTTLFLTHTHISCVCSLWFS